MDTAPLICNTPNTRHHSVSRITCCICHQLPLSTQKQIFTPKNNLNKGFLKQLNSPLSRSHQTNYLQLIQLCTLKRCNLARGSHAMQKKCKVL